MTPKTSKMQHYLMDTLERRRHEADISRRSLASAQISAAALSRLVSGEAATSRAGIDSIVDSYAKALNVEPIELWTEALKLLNQDEKYKIAATRVREARRARQLQATLKWEKKRVEKKGRN